MPATQPNSNSERQYDFTPIDFDPNAEEVQVSPREESYTATLADVKVSKTRPEKGGYPMLILEWETDSGTISDFLVIGPNGAKNSGFGREKYRVLCEMFNLNEEIIPKRLTSKDDFAEFIEAIRGQTADIWVGANKDPARQPNVYYSPRESAPVEETAEAAAPTTAAKKNGHAAPAKKVAPVKKGARR